MPKPGWSQGASPERVLAVLGLAAARRAALLRAAITLQGEWKQILKRPGTGKMYGGDVTFITHNGRVIPVRGSADNPTRGGTHVASAPGEAPASDTGTLANSIAVVETNDGGVRVGTHLRYGLALEFGVNISGSKVGPHPAQNFRLEPRPHARPALRASRSDMTDSLKIGFANLRQPRLG